jgi:hypothetical protein
MQHEYYMKIIRSITAHSLWYIYDCESRCSGLPKMRLNENLPQCSEEHPAETCQCLRALSRIVGARNLERSELPQKIRDENPQNSGRHNCATALASHVNHGVEGASRTPQVEVAMIPDILQPFRRYGWPSTPTKGSA